MTDDAARDPAVRREPSGTASRRRAAILDAATAILVEDGYARLSTRTIAARAGMHPGNLQYYYRTKADVVRAMLERYLEAAARSIEARIAADGATLEARLHAAIDGVLEDQESAEHCRFLRELWALAAHDPAIDAAMRGFYGGFWRRVVAVVLDANPRLGRPRAERRAALLIALLEGLLLFRSPRPPGALPIPGIERELHALVERLVADE